MESEDFSDSVPALLLDLDLRVLLLSVLATERLDVPCQSLRALINVVELDKIEVWVAEEGVEHANGHEFVLSLLTAVLGHLFGDLDQEFAQLGSLALFSLAE